MLENLGDAVEVQMLLDVFDNQDNVVVGLRELGPIKRDTNRRNTK